MPLLQPSDFPGWPCPCFVGLGGHKWCWFRGGRDRDRVTSDTLPRPVFERLRGGSSRQPIPRVRVYDTEAGALFALELALTAG